jgi:uncharacterized protein involved in cysteine biosynthesis
MSEQVGAVRRAYSLWRTDSRVDTALAGLIVLIFVFIPIVRYWWSTRTGGSD